MANASTAHDDLPAPSELDDDALDAMLAELPAPPQTRRRVLTVLLTSISIASIFLATRFADDVRYAMSSSTPVSLGAGLTADPASVGADRYVTLQATPSMAGAVSYSRPLLPGQHLVFPVAGREGRGPIYVQVSREGEEALHRGEFQGRLVPFRGAGGRYAGVGRYVRSRLDATVNGETWLLVDGATPRSVMWAPFLVTFLVALALTDLALLRRLLRPAND